MDDDGGGSDGGRHGVLELSAFNGSVAGQAATQMEEGGCFGSGRGAEERRACHNSAMFAALSMVSRGAADAPVVQPSRWVRRARFRHPVRSRRARTGACATRRGRQGRDGGMGMGGGAALAERGEA